MPKEQFNQTLKTTVGESDRIAVGVPGMTGCDNVTYQNFRKQIGGVLCERQNNKDSNQTFVCPVNSKAISLDIKKISGTPIVKVGLTEGGEELNDSQEIGSDGLSLPLSVLCVASKTIYIGISGGAISYVLEYQYPKF